MSNLRSQTVYVSHFDSKRMSEDLLEKLFGEIEPVQSVSLRGDYAFVNFKDERSVARVCRKLNGIELFNMPLNVKPKARPKVDEIDHEVKERKRRRSSSYCVRSHSDLYYNDIEIHQKRRKRLDSSERTDYYIPDRYFENRGRYDEERKGYIRRPNVSYSSNKDYETHYPSENFEREKYRKDYYYEKDLRYDDFDKRVFRRENEFRSRDFTPMERYDRRNKLNTNSYITEEIFLNNREKNRNDRRDYSPRRKTEVVQRYSPRRDILYERDGINKRSNRGEISKKVYEISNKGYGIFNKGYEINNKRYDINNKGYERRINSNNFKDLKKGGDNVYIKVQNNDSNVSNEKYVKRHVIDEYIGEKDLRTVIRRKNSDHASSIEYEQKERRRNLSKEKFKVGKRSVVNDKKHSSRDTTYIPKDIAQREDNYPKDILKKKSFKDSTQHSKQIKVKNMEENMMKKIKNEELEEGEMSS